MLAAFPRLLVLAVLLGNLAHAQMVLKFDKPKVQSQTLIQQTLSKSGYLKDLVGFFNQSLKFPRALPLHFLSCKESNAFYDPDLREIQMCYELIEEYGQLEEGGSKEDQLLNATVFTLLHELGHALIDQLKLPATGREEDAVDQFATLALLALEDEQAIYSGIEQFLSDAETDDQEDLDFAGAHSLNMQRMYLMTCLVYGSNPKRFKTLPTDYDLPKERASECQEEHDDARYAWNTLLKPHLKNPSKKLL